MDMTKKRNGFYDFFTSIRLAIVLLSAIALGALLGTVIPQQAAAGALSTRLHPALLAVLQALQLFDVYRSAWFILLLPGARSAAASPRKGRSSLRTSPPTGA
jgi:hypothetical protein